MSHWTWTNNYGKVNRLYPSRWGTFFRLEDGKTDMNPKDGYYFVPLDHTNYSALIDLLYMAAEKRYTIHTKTKEELDGEGYAVVIYFVVEW